MRLIEISYILAKYLFYVSLLLLFPLTLAAYDQWHLQSARPSTNAFLLSVWITLFLAMCCRYIGRNATKQLLRRESILLVALVWICSAGLSALPFYFSHTLSRPIDAYFEAMSGLTTTGASLLTPKAYYANTGEEAPIHITHPQVPTQTYTYYGTIVPLRDATTHLVTHAGVEAVDRAVLLWRSMLQWVGGMGIIVIFLSVLPSLGVGGKFLYQMESTGPIKAGLTPRVQETASLLWKLYAALTVLEIVLLAWPYSNVPLFDAICISLANISTGGFALRSENIASYQNGFAEGIIALFMLLGSINFSLYFHLLHRKSLRTHLLDLTLFLSLVGGGALLVSFFLIGTPQAGLEGAENGVYGWKEALRQGSFQAISAQTSTGFITANYDHWPFPSQMILMLLMFIGGMSGSTAGGIKTSRFYILYKIILHRLEALYRPDAIRTLQINGTDVDEKNALTVLAFFCIVTFAVIAGTMLFVLDGIDPETSLGLMACMLNNTGMGFRAAGPTDSFAFLSDFSKWLATFWMLLGRLEFYLILLLFLPAFWRGR